eukprot:TRINITY_DN21556_c0_g1_i1.p1 TRINITY_DN21556_c0_g1~~TRINITY_DN21556_c0_g1_i1.p1  ORF type:complete len:298 (+),score=73.44 TRINITY_DN21556_c0_g1_i1:46-939(+)
MVQKIALFGTGKFGRCIVDELAKRPDQFELVVLSRRDLPEITAQGIKVEVVDYKSLDSLTNALKGVTTLISFMFDHDVNVYVPIHENLIQAAQKVGAKRIIPSEWAGDIRGFEPDAYASKKRIRSLVENSGLEYTFIGNGLFMDYLAPAGKKGYLADVPIPVMPENKSAKIPGTGDEALTLTLAADIGKAVVELLLQDHWPKYFWISGEVTSWNRILKEAEEITGSKFDVTYTPIAQIEENIKQAKDLGPMPHFYAQCELWYTVGLAIPSDPESQRITKNIQFTSARDILTKWYGSK